MAREIRDSFDPGRFTTNRENRSSSMDTDSLPNAKGEYINRSKSKGNLARFGVIITAAIAGAVFLDPYSKSLVTLGLLMSIVVITLDLLWGYTGILSFAQTAFFAIGAYVVAITVRYFEGSASFIIIAFILGVIAAAIVAYLAGLLAFHSKSNWMYAIVVTFAMAFTFEQLALSGGKFTGSSSGITGFLKQSLSVNTSYVLVGAVFVLVLVAADVFVRSDAGLILRAIRENPNRSQYLGLRVNRIKTVLFIIAAGVAAVAGGLYATTQNVVAPDLGGVEMATMIVVWTAVGGRGTLYGPIAAAISLNYATAYLSGSVPYLSQLVLGIAFVLVIVRAPGGLASIGQGAVRLIRKWVTQEERTTTITGAFGKLPAIADNKSELSSEAVLEVEAVSKHYGSFKAVNEVTFSGYNSEIVSIVGPNGAGKSTFMKCVSDGGFASYGAITVGVHELNGKSPEEICRLGVGQKFQTASVFDSLTVWECLAVARASMQSNSLMRARRSISLPQGALDIVISTGLSEMSYQLASTLSHGQKQALELAMVMCTEPKIVLLDEPTAGLSSKERESIAPILKQIASRDKALILIVEHDLNFVKTISSRVLVLHQGAVLMEGSAEEIVESKLVNEIYTGVQ